MPSATLPSSHLFTVQPLSPELRKDTLIGAEVILNDSKGPIDPTAFSGEHISVLRQGLYENSVLVFRKQQGIDPLALEKLAAIWDEDIVNVHSAGKEQVTDARSILSRNNGARLPHAQNVQIIGNGVFRGYEGLNLNLRHVVSEVTRLAMLRWGITDCRIIGLSRISCQSFDQGASGRWRDEVLSMASRCTLVRKPAR